MAGGYGFAAYDELDSTNAEGRRQAEAGEAGPLWIMAARRPQDAAVAAGAGTGGGNLAATLLMRPARPLANGHSFLSPPPSPLPTWRHASPPGP